MDIRDHVRNFKEANAAMVKAVGVIDLTDSKIDDDTLDGIITISENCTSSMDDLMEFLSELPRNDSTESDIAELIETEQVDYD